MISKRFFHLKHLVLGVVVLGLIFVGLNCGKKGEELYNYVPEDVFMIFTLDFQAFTQLDQYKDLSATFSKQFTEAVTDKKFENFMKDADIDLERDLSKATVVMSGTSMENPKAAAIIALAYKKEKFMTALKNSGAQVMEKTYNDVPLFIIKDKSKEAPVLGFIDQAHLVVGMEDMVQKVIDAGKGKIKNVHANKKMGKFLNIASKGHVIAMNFLIPAELKGKKGPFAQMPVSLDKLESVIITINNQSMAFRALSPDAEENKKIADFLNGLKGMAAAAQPKSDQEKQSIEMFKSSSIEAFDDEIRITIATDKVLKFFSNVFTENLSVALQKGKQKATMGDMKTIGIAIESYITDNYFAPEGNSLAEIKDKLEPFYIKTLPLKDGWGNDFLYKHGTGDQKDSYAIASPGKDGVFNGWEQTGYYIVTTMEEFGNDFIFANGMFTYSPKVR
jgi:general secretion pathway protein G